MSYVPFTPDVQPPPAELALPPRGRKLRWVIGALLYLGLLAAWLWWMLLPPRIEPPLAIIPLPDGTELRLVHADLGADFGADHSQTFGHRVRFREPRNPGFVKLGSQPESAWLVFTRFDPRTERFSPPGIDAFAVVEASPAYAYRGFGRSSINAGSEHPVQIIWLPYYPTRASPWTIELARHGTVVKAPLPNPFFSPAAPALVPKPLPQKVAIEGATMELTGVQLRDAQAYQPRFWDAGAPTGMPQGDPPTFTSFTANPIIRIQFGAQNRDAFTLSHKWFDATGDAPDVGVLPFSEPAWGLRVRAVQHTPSTEVESMHPLGEFTIPVPGEMVALPVPPALAAFGVTDVVLVGKGAYTAAPNLLKNSAAGTAAPSLKLANPAAQLTDDVTVPSLLVFSSAEVANAAGFPLFVARVGEGFIPCSVNRSHSGTDFYGRRYDLKLRKAPDLSPGTKVTLWATKSKVLEATFHIPPPTPPALK